MLLVLSDLHFEEERSDFIGAYGSAPPLTFSRNLDATFYQRCIALLARDIRRAKSQKLKIVLAGDIFDLHRSSLWFSRRGVDSRPYVDNRDVRRHADLERLILALLSRIGQEREVRKTLGILNLLLEGKYRVRPGGTVQDFPAQVQLEYIPGNHDRLANATPLIRKRVRELLGLPLSDEPFPCSIWDEEHRVRIRHGHEYDRHNFCENLMDIEHWDDIPATTYGKPCIGDFITVDIAARLPFLFRRLHGDATIVTDPILRTVYTRLLEFDDLRPQSAILDFLLTIPGMEEGTVWKVIEPVLRQIFDDIHANPFLRECLDDLDKKWRLDTIDAVQLFLDTRPWHNGILLNLAKSMASKLRNIDFDNGGPAEYALHEPTVRSGRARMVIAGHTHTPSVDLLKIDERGQQYYLDTGTWRRRIVSSPDRKAFGSIKSLTSLTVFSPSEFSDGAATSARAFSVWNGITRRWDDVLDV